MRFAIIIPVYNHAGSIGRVMEQVRTATRGLTEIEAVIVINDGCTDGSAEVLDSMPGLTVLTHARNRGKGEALLTGFRHAELHGCTHAITMDADGQHDAGDIPQLIAAARAHPADLIIGWRDMDAARGAGGGEAPANSKRGRDISRFWLRVQTGQDIPDSQCGLRIYPLRAALAVPHLFGRFDFETEILARVAWAGAKICSVPVSCIYFAQGVRVSHFRPVIDTLRGVRVNVFLVARRLVPLPFHRGGQPADSSHRFGHWWKISAWRAAFRLALQAGNTNAELATAFALGVFVGLTPFYFLQTILAIYLARRLHLNIVAAVIGSQISIPPLFPLWFALSYGLGNFLLRGQWINVPWRTLSRGMFPTLLLGSVILAAIAAAVSLLLARQILARVRPRPLPTC